MPLSAALSAVPPSLAACVASELLRGQLCTWCGLAPTSLFSIDLVLRPQRSLPVRLRASPSRPAALRVMRLFQTGGALSPWALADSASPPQCLQQGLHNLLSVTSCCSPG